MIVYVVTLNDGPEGVRATYAAAEAFVEERRAHWVRSGAKSHALHFRIHEYDMPETDE